MYLGLTDSKGLALHPEVVTRVPLSTIKWDLIYGSHEEPLLFVNNAEIIFYVLKDFVGYPGVGFFRKVDDFEPAAPVVELYTAVKNFHWSESITIARHQMRIASNITGGALIQRWA